MKGIYILVVSVGIDIRIAVGSLGSVFFDKGLYAYVGSAQNHLEKRIQRHLRKDKRMFWHIDYLLESDSVEVMGFFRKEASKSEECRVAGELLKVAVPVVDFGSSDCRCMSHLFRFGDSLAQIFSILDCIGTRCSGFSFSYCSSILQD